MHDSPCRTWCAGLALTLVALASPGSVLALDACDPPPPTGAAIPFEEHAGARRESEIRARSQGSEVPQIGFIDSPTTTCYQPDPAADVCWINWYYLAVDANPNYMICMEVTINEVGKVARYQGFFQTSMYAPYNMHDRGFRVPCGAPGAGGDPNRGNSYGFTIRAKDSANLGSANYGSIFCPPYTP